MIFFQFVKMVCVLIDGVTTPIRSFRMEMDDGCPKMILPVRVDFLFIIIIIKNNFNI